MQMSHNARTESEGQCPPSLQVNPGRVAWREVEGEIVALDLADSTYFTVNHAGGLLWTELAGGATRDSLVSTLVREYAIETNAAVRDVDSFIDGLEARGLLTDT
jgi:hypothetical protein